MEHFSTVVITVVRIVKFIRIMKINKINIKALIKKIAFKQKHLANYDE
jgi:hypothetical protein